MNLATLVYKLYSARWELVRFGVVGVIATLLHYGIYLLMLRLANINESIAYSIGYATSFSCNFLLSSYFTFRTKPTVKKGFGFGLSHLLNYLLHMILLNFFLWAGLSDKLAPLPVFAIVIPVNFILVRFFLKGNTNGEKDFNNHTSL